jgi:hypothetical protein
MAYGIQRVARPHPHFGGAPRFAARCQVTSLDPEQKPPSGAVVYDVLIEAVISLSPPFTTI